MPDIYIESKKDLDRIRKLLQRLHFTKEKEISVRRVGKRLAASEIKEMREVPLRMWAARSFSDTTRVGSSRPRRKSAELCAVTCSAGMRCIRSVSSRANPSPRVACPWSEPSVNGRTAIEFAGP